MFEEIKLKNYKSLLNFNVKLTGTKKKKRMVMIYGENGGGKSNFSSVFLTLKEFLKTKNNVEEIKKMLADIEEEQLSKTNLMKLKTFLIETEKIIEKSKTISSKENMTIEVIYKNKNKRYLYLIETDDKHIVKENLKIEEKKEWKTLYSLETNNFYIDENLIKEKGYRKEINNQVEQVWGLHSFLSIITYEIKNKTKEYINKNLGSTLLDTINFFNNICIKINEGYDRQIGFVGIPEKMLRSFIKGEVKLEEEEVLQKTEELLNLFFTSTYTDIKEVFYKKITDQNKIEYELFFKKQLYEEIKEIPFRLESTGTHAILNLIPYILCAISGKIVVIDEIDSGIHDIFINNLLVSLNESISGQLIITTHNTMLLENREFKDYIYIISIDENGSKELLPISYFEKRIHPNLNIRKRYLKGIYTGVPYMNKIDFSELAEIME